MSEKVLSSLMHFFATFFKLDANIDIDIAKNIVISFLQKQFDKETTETYTAKFIALYSNLKNENISNTDQAINSEHTSDFLFHSLPFKQRVYLIINLLSFSRFLSAFVSNKETTGVIAKKIDDIANAFKLKEEIYSGIKLFAFGEFQKILDNNNFLIITSLELSQNSAINKLIIKNLKGQFFVLKFNYNFFLLLYQGNEDIYLDHKLIIQDNLYIISNNSQISSKEFPTIHFNDLLKTYLQTHKYPEIRYSVTNIEYDFSKTKKGFHPFSFECKQSEMVCIIGSSGVGKSTLLKLLCGVLPLHAGEIKINDYNLQERRENLKDFVGYIPQEEILIENLTVYENILYHARLCTKIESDTALRNNIIELLENLGLYDIKDYKVGTISHKIISGGQRKRLNIAMELIRNPDILFIDEPTSGLSSSDAEKIIGLLKQQVLKGKLVFVNLHQPSNQVLHLFDNLIVVDKGGYPVYFGHPANAYKYLTNKSKVVSATKFNAEISESEKILEIIEETTIDEFGNPTTNRKIKPEVWYCYYRDSNQKSLPPIKDSKQIFKDRRNNKPGIKTSETPNRLKQFFVYVSRNYKTKFANKSYIFISLLVSPILALVLTLLSKQMFINDIGKFEYLFSANENIPSFVFMSIIVSLFVGLMSSAEEIIKDKRTLTKEAFLNISTVSYICSKLVYLFTLSLVQSVLYTIVSYMVLQFNSGFFIFFVTLFSISFIANIMGLTISTLFNTTVAVYILIPFIIIPQILLSGIVIKFENINPHLSSIKYTPIISDLMPTRWAYELIMVDQFKNNKYQVNLFNVESEISAVNFNILAVIPEIRERLDELIECIKKDDKITDSDIQFIINGLQTINLDSYSDFADFKAPNTLLENLYKINDELDVSNLTYAHKRDSLFAIKDLVFKHIIAELGSKEALVEFRNRNHNSSIAKLLLQKESFRPYIIWKNQIVQKTEPIYKRSDSNIGRAQFFASNKQIGRLHINTIKFNLFVIFTYSFLLTILLYILFRKKYKFK